MDYKEFVKIVGIISDNFPYFLKVEDQQRKLETWYGYLKEMEYRRVLAKLNDYILHNKFEPKIADIRPIELTPVKDYEQIQKDLFKQSVVREENKPHAEKVKQMMDENPDLRKFIAMKKAQFAERKKEID